MNNEHIDNHFINEIMTFTNFDGKRKENVSVNSKRGRSTKDPNSKIRKYEVQLPVPLPTYRLMPTKALISRFVLRYVSLVGNQSNLQNWRGD